MFELRHLRYFVAVAEELHYGRAAERLGIEQSPLSRAIKDLEAKLGVRLFERTTRSTRLTRAGQLFLVDTRRLFGILEASKARVRALGTGFYGHLRVGVCDGVIQKSLISLLLRCREEVPSIYVELLEMPFADQIHAVQDGSLDAVFSLGNQTPLDVAALALWTHPLSLIVPSTHPLANAECITLDAVLEFPLILCDPKDGSGCDHQINALLAGARKPIKLAERANSLEVTLTMVAAGYGIAFAMASPSTAAIHPEIVVKAVAEPGFALTTYLLVRNDEHPVALQQFISYAEAVSAAN